MAATTTQWILELVDKITAPMKSITDAADKAAKGVDGVGDKANGTGKKFEKMSAIDLYAVNDSVGQLAGQFDAIVAPGAAFDAQLKDLSAITGVVGDDLDTLGDAARDTAIKFGGDASAMLQSYKGILSRFGPDIAKDKDALDSMGQSVATLSKTMGGDSVGAMDALTTAMLQMGVDLSNPQAAAEAMNRMMNVMAAGAKEGASEVTQIGDAYKQAGVQIKQSNVSFEEGNAALQALAQGGKYGSEAGVALRNVLGKMAGLDVLPKESVEKLKALCVNYDIVSDKSLPLTTRLRELKKAQADSTLVAQMFGVENAAAANILMESADYQDKLRQKITATNVATEQANTVMSGYSETMSRAKAWFTDLAIGAFGVTSKIAPMVDGLSGAVSIFANLANARKGVSMLFGLLQTMPVIGKVVAFGSSLASSGFAMMSTAAKALGVAIMNIPIIGWIAAIVAALIALGVYFWKTSATFRGVLMGVWSFLKTAFLGYYKFIWEVMQAIWHVIRGVFDPRTWFDKNYKFSDAFDKVVGAAKKYGSDLAKAYSEGKKEGEDSYYKDNPDENPKKQKQKGSGGAAPIKSVSPKLTTTDLGKGKAESLGDKGGAKIQTITQTIKIENHFTIEKGASQSDIDETASKVVRAINDKLRDGMITTAS